MRILVQKETESHIEVEMASEVFHSFGRHARRARLETGRGRQHRLWQGLPPACQ